MDKAFQQNSPSGLLIGGALAGSREPGNAVLWVDGVVAAAGPLNEVKRSAPKGIPTYEFPASIITPGFIDSHTHFAQWALKRRQIDLTGAATRSEALARIARGVPVQGWVQGQGWDANDWQEAPDRASLDAIQPGPVFLDSLDVHAVWVNSAALDLAGISAETPDPPGGRIVRDPSGRPTGVLMERAVDLVRRVVPEPEPAALRRALLEGQAEAHRLGVTGIHNVEDLHVLAAFRALEAEDLLRLRVLFHPPVGDLPTLIATGHKSGAGTPWITNGGIKLFLDGSLGSRTAWMLEPYEGTRDRGMPLSTLEDAAGAVRLAAEHGIAATVHAIGDAAVRRALDLLEPLPRTGISHRIEHFQCVSDLDLHRAAQAGIVLSMQPAHILVDIPLAERHWGKRGRGAYAFRSLAQHGAELVFGSDAPVAPLDPRHGVFAAMERRALGSTSSTAWYGDERLAFEDVVKAYTATPARAASWFGRLGTLAPGHSADLVVWDADPGVLRGDGNAFLHAAVRLTVVGGQIVLQT